MFSRLFVRSVKSIKPSTGLRRMHTYNKLGKLKSFYTQRPVQGYLPRRTFWGQQPPSDFDVTKDYYKILGVSKTASKADIKKKYFEYVKKMHPDRNPNADQEKFKELTSAYNVLSNEKKRKEYDDYRSMAGQGFPNPGSSSYSSSQSPFGAGFDPYGKSSYYKQDFDRNGQYKRYYYKTTSTNPEEIRKEFEKFFKKANEAFNQKQRQGQGRGQTRYNFHNAQGFDDFSKKFWETYEKQRQSQRNQSNSHKSSSHQSDFHQNNSNQSPFNYQFMNFGAPSAGVLIFRLVRNFMIIYFFIYLLKVVLFGSSAATRASGSDMYQYQIARDTYDKKGFSPNQAPNYYPPQGGVPQYPPQGHPQYVPEHMPRADGMNYQRSTEQRFYDPSQDPRYR
ncbi:unnamed protein product [Moneuplotes crassus]|uniref:J domain-containing protein n=1 Tax=Euplotes crassus TaxID=5936 RepID=A0AAD1U342_EUPCR|nr:unnamed protein product [Moneuplotes crassus]